MIASSDVDLLEEIRQATKLPHWRKRAPELANSTAETTLEAAPVPVVAEQLVTMPEADEAQDRGGWVQRVAVPEAKDRTVTKPDSKPSYDTRMPSTFKKAHAEMKRWTDNHDIEIEALDDLNALKGLARTSYSATWLRYAMPLRIAKAK